MASAFIIKYIHLSKIRNKNCWQLSENISNSRTHKYVDQKIAFVNIALYSSNGILHEMKNLRLLWNILLLKSLLQYKKNFEVCFLTKLFSKYLIKSTFQEECWLKSFRWTWIVNNLPFNFIFSFRFSLFKILKIVVLFLLQKLICIMLYTMLIINLTFLFRFFLLNIWYDFQGLPLFYIALKFPIPTCFYTSIKYIRLLFYQYHNLNFLT
jgi:hypothetical protein